MAVKSEPNSRTAYVDFAVRQACQQADWSSTPNACGLCGRNDRRVGTVLVAGAYPEAEYDRWCTERVGGMPTMTKEQALTRDDARWLGGLLMRLDLIHGERAEASSELAVEVYRLSGSYTLEAIAKILGVTRQRVAQLRDQGKREAQPTFDKQASA